MYFITIIGKKEPNVNPRTKKATGTLIHSLPVGVQNGRASLEDRLAISYKTKHILGI